MSEWLTKLGLWAVGAWVLLCVGVGVWLTVVGLAALADHFLTILCLAGFIAAGSLFKWGWRKWVG